MRRFSSNLVGFWYRDPRKLGSLRRAISTWTSSITRALIGRGSFLTTRITSSTLVLMEGGNRPLHLLDARLRKRVGRYQRPERPLLLRSRRCSIFAFSS